MLHIQKKSPSTSPNDHTFFKQSPESSTVKKVCLDLKKTDETKVIALHKTTKITTHNEESLMEIFKQYILENKINIEDFPSPEEYDNNGLTL